VADPDVVGVQVSQFGWCPRLPGVAHDRLPGMSVGARADRHSRVMRVFTALV
jgi:hypothetical protein